jgi:hypothetical protein
MLFVRPLKCSARSPTPASKRAQNGMLGPSRLGAAGRDRARKRSVYAPACARPMAHALLWRAAERGSAAALDLTLFEVGDLACRSVASR